jgi:hypothetical protein
MTESPLVEVNSNSLEELFSTTPLERTPAEWKVVVEALRAQRSKWAQQEASGTKTTKAGPKATKAPKAIISLDETDFTE